METLLLISHPKIKDSITQEFLKESQAKLKSITWHPLDEIYPTGNVDVAREQELLTHHQRIIFQFPLYWYSAPASLKIWEDDVLTRAFTYANEDGRLKGKQLGIVMTTGYQEADFAAGASQGFSISQLTAPYQAAAKQAGMEFMTPLVISQFGYLSEEEKERLLVNYQMYLNAPYPFNFDKKTTWMMEKLDSIGKHGTRNDAKKINLINDEIKKNQEELIDLKSQVNLIRKDEE